MLIEGFNICIVGFKNIREVKRFMDSKMVIKKLSMTKSIANSLVRAYYWLRKIY